MTLRHFWGHFPPGLQNRRPLQLGPSGRLIFFYHPCVFLSLETDGSPMVSNQVNKVGGAIIQTHSCEFLPSILLTCAHEHCPGERELFLSMIQVFLLSVPLVIGVKGRNSSPSLHWYLSGDSQPLSLPYYSLCIPEDWCHDFIRRQNGLCLLWRRRSSTNPLFWLLLNLGRLVVDPCLIHSNIPFQKVLGSASYGSRQSREIVRRVIFCSTEKCFGTYLVDTLERPNSLTIMFWILS